MRFLSFFNQKKDALVALFDIGSASVGGALARVPNADSVGSGNLPEILWSRRKEIPFQNVLDTANFSLQISNALKDIAKEMLTAASGHPTMILCTFSSPWYTAQTRIARSAFAAPTTISPNIISALADAETAAFKSTHMSQAKSGGLTLLEQKIMHIRLNGYATVKPYAKRAQDIDIALYVSMGPVEFINKIRTIIEQIFHRAADHEHSLAFVSFSMLRDLSPEREHFLMCDIGGEITEVSLVRDHILVETVSFPKGRMTLLRALASALKRSPEETLSMLALFFGGLRKEDKSFALLSSLVDDGRETWLSSFREALALLGGRNALADTIEITAHSIMRPWLEPAFLGDSFMIGGIGRALTLKPRFIDTTFLRKRLSFARAEQFDSFLALETLFAQKLLNLESDTI